MLCAKYLPKLRVELVNVKVIKAVGGENKPCVNSV